ncbi:metal dependent phosphohydrolase [Hydrogenobacter thermophilus TK-6]|uniref:Metal dependent phosphohydrolase n=1 Tax=Hydrogenobacter thermophilus (strain DSM 6534 / IAM 12695 / TK-6) TaxID=608538 RepID=D3DHD9_HYDTT|nr:HD domain-containing protein [Hydrogenobacter thermophilus]ADO45178.1 metal dependent phosphohydrolase [Hydrogenobacter thermophilus TK-6]BAI69241.1 metal dependent phosphohydrolase [Hydrogenobacter thermophilus TK-6]
MFKDLSDPIYGFVRVEDHELKVIDAILFQRLRYIRQLGVAYLVFPSAQHTRFEHSVGVMELSTRIYKSLGFKDDRLMRVVRLAGLLHDIGHPPFSHTTEVLLGSRGHEDIGYKVIMGQVGDMLKKEGFSWEEVQLIAKLAFKKAQDDSEKLLSNIITGEFGADRMDYLRRDAYFCGTSYGFFDYERLLNHIELVEGKKTVNLSALRALESFILGRYFMYLQVYFHKVVRILNIHLLEMIERFFGSDYFLNAEKLMTLTDGDILSVALKYPQDIHVKRLMGREHFREVFRTNSKEEFERAKEDLLAVYDPQLVRFDSVSKKVLDEEIFVSEKGKVFPLKEVSEIFSSLKDIEIHRIYAERSLKDDIKSYLAKRGYHGKP